MKNERLPVILELVNSHALSSQEELLKMLREKGFTITQATLSRDIRQLKITKLPDTNGHYIYATTSRNIYSNKPVINRNGTEWVSGGFISFDFSGQLCVIKTRPGFANGIASEIDRKASKTVLGTIAGDDTILLIPREGVRREEISQALSYIINEI
jgi:transcriptional regulator of arginine metabolism